jgi:predicted NAD/FAD-dependent oxidoreductase
VHRWRYASVPRTHASDVARCAWDADAGLGLCGDAWGGPGVEGAWLSGQALAQALIGEPAAAGSTRP